ncbi:MAG: aminomethyl-transferring glycine dehydrogenase subunit GcvPA [Candidatus Eisenbacteria bacterium]|nr:aminomethyl-transferring glycine dehydrogenase subunit GcvPA [Candidatus Eisenbacteria bacterium]
MHPFISTSKKEREEMLKAVGISSFEEILSPIPADLRMHLSLNLPKALSELEVIKKLSAYSSLNLDSSRYVSFLGGGIYDHFVPSAIPFISSRSEFATSYTPYQPEVSQGTLQAIFEYQSMMAELTSMDAVNASLYDAATACAEAALLAASVKGRKRVLVSFSVNPFYRNVIETYLKVSGIKVETIPAKDGVTDREYLSRFDASKFDAIFIQHPNFFGLLEDPSHFSEFIHDGGGLLVSVVNPISLALLKPPGKYGADIAVGEAQPLGNGMNFGGPLLGFFATKMDLVRRMPGRLVGETVDLDGRRGFVLTLQTREQHIRREKATSNICTNESLLALSSAIYLSLMGKDGLKEVAKQCLMKAHFARKCISEVEGFSIAFRGPAFNEFAVKCPVPAAQVIKKSLRKGVLAGVGLSLLGPAYKNFLLVAVTEKRTKDDILKLAESLRRA